MSAPEPTKAATAYMYFQLMDRVMTAMGRHIEDIDNVYQGFRKQGLLEQNPELDNEISNISNSYVKTFTRLKNLWEKAAVEAGQASDETPE